jgi:hypothetical protein
MGAAFAVGPGDLGATLDGLGYPPAQVENRLRCWPSRIKAMIADGGQLPSAATLFPNLSLLHTWAAIHAEGTIAPFTTMRVWQPISESETEILSWFLVDRDAEPEFKKASYKAYIMCFGPSGMLEQDDMENWVSLTQTAGGRMARRLLLNNRMGLREDGSQTREPLKDFPGPGEAREGFNEHNQRQWLRLWSECIDAERPVSAPCPTMR